MRYLITERAKACVQKNVVRGSQSVWELILCLLHSKPMEALGSKCGFCSGSGEVPYRKMTYEGYASKYQTHTLILCSISQPGDKQAKITVIFSLCFSACWAAKLPLSIPAWVIFQVYLPCKSGVVLSIRYHFYLKYSALHSLRIIANNCQKVVATLSQQMHIMNGLLFKPRIPLNMPVGFWVPAVKWCCFWQGSVSKWGIISLISVVWSASHDILSVFSFYTLSEQSHSPGSSQWGCQRLRCAVKQQMVGQWKICSPNPWVHVRFRVKFQRFPSLFLGALWTALWGANSSVCTWEPYEILFCTVLKLGSRPQLEI